MSINGGCCGPPISPLVGTARFGCPPASTKPTLATAVLVLIMPAVCTMNGGDGENVPGCTCGSLRLISTEDVLVAVAGLIMVPVMVPLPVIVLGLGLMLLRQRNERQGWLGTFPQVSILSPAMAASAVTAAAAAAEVEAVRAYTGSFKKVRLLFDCSGVQITIGYTNVNRNRNRNARFFFKVVR